MSFDYGGASCKDDVMAKEEDDAMAIGTSEQSFECGGKLTKKVKRKKKTIPAFVGAEDELDGNDDEASKEFMRVPNDPIPFDGYEKSDVVSEGICFPSQFAPDIPESLDDMASEDIKTAYSRITKMIKENYSNNMVTRDLVNNVHKFYEENIRANYPDMPPWSKKSIYNYIFFNSDSGETDERQANESIRAIYHQIDFLRSHSVSRNPQSGKVVPEFKNIKLMCDLAKTHAQLVSAKKQRRK